MRRLLVFLFLALVYTAAAQTNSRWPEPIVDDPGLKERRDVLITHGIMPATQPLIRFLENGFNMDAVPKGLPAEPLLKTQVILYAIQELGVTGAEEAVPVLIKFANQDLPEGAAIILMRDFESIPVQRRGQRMSLARQVMALNAVSALGLIGDERGIDPVLAAMRREKPTSFITRGAVALGQMGSNKGLASTVLLASKIESQDSVEAFNTIYYLTGRNYGYTEHTSLARRRELVEQLRTWFDTEGQDVKIYRGEVMRRLFSPLPPDDTLDPGSLRGMLRATRDVRNYDRRYAARQSLQSIAPNRFDDLRAIVEDPMEDLDIRRAAMNWLAATDPKRARKILRRQENDENPIIAEIALRMEEDIERALEYEKRQAKDN